MSNEYNKSSCELLISAKLGDYILTHSTPVHLDERIFEWQVKYAASERLGRKVGGSGEGYVNVLPAEDDPDKRVLWIGLGWHEEYLNENDMAEILRQCLIEVNSSEVLYFDWSEYSSKNRASDTMGAIARVTRDDIRFMSTKNIIRSLLDNPSQKYVDSLPWAEISVYDNTKALPIKPFKTEGFGYRTVDGLPNEDPQHVKDAFNNLFSDDTRRHIEAHLRNVMRFRISPSHLYTETLKAAMQSKNKKDVWVSLLQENSGDYCFYLHFHEDCSTVGITVKQFPRGRMSVVADNLTAATHEDLKKIIGEYCY